MTITQHPKKLPRMHNADHIYRLIDHALATRYVRQQLVGVPRTSVQLSESQQSSPGSQSMPIMRPRMALCDESESPNLNATFELPGMKKEEIAIEVCQGCLVVSGDRRPPESSRTRTYPIEEIKYGPFRRVVPLPRGIDASQITASMNDGLLVVSWPRSGPAEEPQRVEVG
ncbi:HSP20-like chaperone [Neolentinus lepideus HHB14362 ss-1]|uniref:HSP20-like chaperone n=1 Tax=Neolentinus lepideus HHB14362 ss-1 TaxID=1314782 RepID=A0A165QEJ7_9AGAM|nr:HSP20-like chaperone [Neolentinus lepideus HHB14362 ss-1]